MDLLRALAIAVVLAASCAPARAADLATAEQQALDAAVAKVEDCVVQIRTIGGLERVDEQTLAQGPTTGLIITADGYIVSSAINFAQRPTSILVRLPGGVQQPAEIVGRDDNRMLVLLKVEPPAPLPTPTPAPLDSVRPGDWALALGRTYSGDRVSVSVGIVSALRRMHGRVMQTDANVSAANYGGPLIDVEGRVLGVLAPMSPQSGGGDTSALAGAEYYDSGIGFAVPLAHVLDVLDRWKASGDLNRGLLGVSLKPGNPHASPPVITTIWPRSPAAEAGWKTGDRIIAVDGAAVDTQTELRFQVAPHYAGDKLEVSIRRGKGDDAEEKSTAITLIDKLPAYRHPFLGIVPERRPTAEAEAEKTDNETADAKPAAAEAEAANEPDAAPNSAGVLVRAVWPDSPADRAGLKPQDRVLRLGDAPADSIEQAIAALNAHNPDDRLEVVVRRGEEELKLQVQLAELPADPLASSDLPATDEPADDEVKLEELKLPEMPQTARFLRPSGDDETFGLLVWLGAGGDEAAKAAADSWARVCRRDRVILLLPEPGAATGWSSDDLEYLARLLQTAMTRFDVDPRRVVVAGEGKGGQLAYALAFQGRKLVRGVVVVDSPLPRTLQAPPNSPNERLAILSIETQDSPLAQLIRQDLRKVQEAGYPVGQLARRSSESRGAAPLDAATRAKVARWLDALDRF